MPESPNDQNLDVIYEQLDMECADLEKRIASIRNIMDSYKQVLSVREDNNFNLLLSDEDSEMIIKQYQIKWLHNNYLLSMLDISLPKAGAVISREGHFRIMYQIMGFSKASNLALITLESIAEHKGITKEDFVITFLDSFHESMVTHDPYFKKRNKHILDATNHFYEIKTNIKNILNKYNIDSNEQRVKILLNSIHHLFTHNVIDKSLTLDEEKVIKEIESINIFETKDKLFFFVPLKEMLALYITQLN